MVVPAQRHRAATGILTAVTAPPGPPATAGVG